MKLDTYRRITHKSNKNRKKHDDFLAVAILPLWVGKIITT